MMYFPSLSVLTTLACAVFSVAAPLGAPAVPNGVTDGVTDKLDELHNNVNVPRQTPDVPSTAASPLVVALNGLVIDLEPALAALVQVVDGKVAVEVNTKELKVAILNVLAVVASHVENIKQGAIASVNNVQAEVVGNLLVQIISAVYTALETVAAVGALAQEVLNPLVAEITSQLTAVVGAVFVLVPSVVQLVVSQVQPLLKTVVHLNIVGIFQTIGVEAPVS
jgi:hypothetical protein